MNISDIQKITKYIFLNSNFKKADIAFVFGTRHQEAIDKVFEIYREKLVPKVLISGGVNRITGRNEVKEMSKKLIELGIQEEDIILEDQSTNSLENVLFSKKIVEEKIGLKNLKRIIVVVKHYHSRRALMTLRKHFPKTIELIPITYEVCDFTKDNWYETKNGREKVLSEWKKIIEYLVKGDIEEI